VVDLSGLAFIDSSGIRVLVVAAKAIESRGGSAALAAPAPHIERVFDTVHLSEVVAVYPSLEEAVEAVRQSVGGGR
jgi:anti-sigma B factor antagonist